jgi:drug/metabolite transporter (DMT)-like permease
MLTMSSTVVSAAKEATVTLAPSLFNNVPAVGAAWMVSSAVFTTYSTTSFLKYKHDEDRGKKVTLEKPEGSKLPRATLLTLYRFGGSLLLGMLAHPDLHVVDRVHETIQLLPPFAMPAIFLFIANYANSIALDRIGISLTYTSKCAIPLITVLLTLILDGASSLPSIPVLLCLLPIALGIGAASWNSPTFEKIGFTAAMISCTSQSALNVSCKKVMTKLVVGGGVAQRAMVAVGLLIATGLSLAQMASHNEAKRPTQKQPPAWLAAMATIAYHVEYVLSFTFVSLVAPITYGACDAVRRLSIIISGRAMFGGEPFTRLNIAGIAMALVGALSYSILNK